MITQSELEHLIKLSSEGHKCPNDSCPEYEAFNQCYNHAHVLCPEFELYYKKEKKQDPPTD